MKKHVLSMILTGLILLNSVALASCSNNENKDIGDTTANTQQENGTDTTISEIPDKYLHAKEVLESLPKKDYNGVDFNILTRAAVGTSEKEVYIEEMDGDVINDAVYTRNQNVNDRFNVKIKMITGDVKGLAQKSILAEDNAYDLIYPDMPSAASLAMEGFLYNYKDFKDVNLEEVWWDKGTRELAISGKNYFMNGDINYLDNDVTYILMFNKKLVQNEDLKEPYDLVKQGKWTIDEFTTMIKNVTEDIDGDGKFTDSDKYGFISTGGGPRTFFYSSGLKIINVDDETGTPSIVLDDPKTLTVLEKVNNIFHKDNATITPKVGSLAEGGVGITSFIGDRGLFYGEVLSYISNLRDMETPFGVVPFPKLDESQENYITHVDPISSTVAVPANCPDPEKTGLVLEAMAIESFIHVTPAYYDIALQRKFIRDDESSEMLDIILANRVYDMGLLYSSIGLNDLFNSLGNKGSNDFASSYAKVSDRAKKALDKIVSKYSEVNQ